MTVASDRLDALADSCLLVGFAGTTATDELRRWVSAGLGGVVLFGRNVVDPEQVAALTAALREERDDVIVAVDEEGGQVSRLQARTGSSYPGNAALGHLDDVAVTERVAASIGAELATVGVDLDLAPVADVNVNAANPVIGIRSFGAEADLVGRHVAAYVRGLHASGISGCAKHFPGHGDTTVDSHLALPVVDQPRERLDAVELAPFRAAVEAGVESIMTAHIVFPALDDAPATLSRRILTDLLRGELGFSGAVVTDALEMQAIADGVGIGEGAVLSLLAGADLLCTGLQEEPGRLAVTAVRAALRDGRLPVSRLEEAAARAEGLRANARRLAGRSVTPDRAYGGEVAARALVVRDPDGLLPLRGEPLVVELEGERSVGVGGSTVRVADVLSAARPQARNAVVRRGDTLPETDGHPVVVVCRDLAREPWQLDALAALAADSSPVAVVLTGLAADARLLPDALTTVACHGAGGANVAAAVRALVGADHA